MRYLMWTLLPIQNGKSGLRNSSGTGIAQRMTLGQIVQKLQALMNKLMLLPVFSDGSHLNVRQIGKSIGFSSCSVNTILTEILGMTSLSGRWVPRMLTTDHKVKRVDISKTLLIRFLANPKNFHRPLVTQNQTWVQHFELKSKIQSKQVFSP